MISSSKSSIDLRSLLQFYSVDKYSEFILKVSPHCIKTEISKMQTVCIKLKMYK